MIRLIHGAATHLGLVRRQNEDSFVAADGLYAVCDGMGGARAGEVASEAACRILAALPEAADAQDLREAVTEANTVIRQRSLADGSLAGMGTTLTAATARGSALTLAQVGDSRAYLWRRGVLRQVTEDHSLVAEMIKRGQLTPEQASVHPHRSIITRALGTEPSVTPDIFDLPLEDGDRVLLCSDGLSGMVPEKELERLLAAGDDPQGVADALVAAALRHGGEDNVTAVLIFAVDDGGDPASAGAAADVLGGASPLEVTAHDAHAPSADRAVPSEGQTPDAAETDPPGLEAPAPGAPGEIGGDGSAATAVGADALGPSVREAAEMRSRFRPSRRALVIGVAVAVAVLALASVGFAAFNSTVYFVGTDDGQVALFQGMPYAVVGIDLYSVVEVAPARFDSLDTHVQERVDAHELVTKEEGLRFIRGLDAAQ